MASNQQQDNFDTSSIFDTGNDPFSTIDYSSTEQSGNESPTLDFGHLDRINPLTIAPALGVYAPGYGNSPEYLFAEDYTDYRKKSWGEQLMYWTGVSYLSGAVTGGSYGCIEGLRSSGGKSWKLRVNAILNASGRRGAALANACGILALMFSGFESIYDHYIGDDAVYNYALAGISAGLVYKSTAGLKPASIYSTGLGLVGVLGIYAARQGIYGRRLQTLV
ncbi:mitochondrial protein translocase, MPT family [Galdieria sulphuraria]|uniref:Mitochondrial protein translocase, MPT family n=1 Tax=Galdieria sulphuraria TaxID=130081 RepID=M2XSI8_GALSU|nr:mitochondrial protein translocase, MPT family [Galdieria sulphuraria]EME26648.1 mitochondrial protein translocase, MPT family [Galdieria sulphuraria]|eukprot:XP_005703168.1 mitochondrial protein translocase, MPT family [Galdieria sulphuraria]